VCAKSVETLSHKSSLYANGSFQEHIIGRFFDNLVKEKCLLNSRHTGWGKLRLLSGPEGLEPVKEVRQTFTQPPVLLPALVLYGGDYVPHPNEMRLSIRCKIVRNLKPASPRLIFTANYSPCPLQSQAYAYLTLYEYY